MADVKMSYGRIAGFCRGMALLLHAGVGVAEGVFLLAEEESGEFQALLRSLGESMDRGYGLSDAMKESAAFPDHVTGMLRIGEETGRMEETLETLAAFYEERVRIAKQIRTAVAYPGMLMLLMLAVISVLLIKVLPVFDEVYASLGGRLTGIAAGLLHLGQAMETMLPVLLVLLMLMAALVLAYTLYAPLREKISSWAVQKFGDRGVSRKYNNAHFGRALAMGLSSGLPEYEAMVLAQSLLEDIPAAAERCSHCCAMLDEGRGLPEALIAVELISPAQGRMLSAGVRGGSADRVMEDIAGKLMEEAGDALEGAVSRIEPAMVMATSLLVGAILLAVMLPLMNIMSMIG